MAAPWEDYAPQPAGSPWEAYQDTKPATRMDKFQQGLRDPIDGGAQLLTNILPRGIVAAGNRADNWLSEKTGVVTSIPEGGLNQVQTERNRAYEARRAAAGDEGFDGYRLLGNVANPVNFLPGAALPNVATLPARVALGAGVGAVNGALAPVNEGDYAANKAKQIGYGAIGGGVMPVALGGRLSRH